MEISPPGHPFFDRLNRLLAEHGFDRFVEQQCLRFYAPGVGRPSLSPAGYCHLLLIGYFEGMDSERGIVRSARTAKPTGFSSPATWTLGLRLTLYSLPLLNAPIGPRVSDRRRFFRLHWDRARRILSRDPARVPRRPCRPMTACGNTCCSYCSRASYCHPGRAGGTPLRV
jgi:hypothetical protein